MVRWLITLAFSPNNLSVIILFLPSSQQQYSTIMLTLNCAFEMQNFYLLNNFLSFLVLLSILFTMLNTFDHYSLK